MSSCTALAIRELAPSAVIPMRRTQDKRKYLATPEMIRFSPGLTVSANEKPRADAAAGPIHPVICSSPRSRACGTYLRAAQVYFIF